MRMKVRTLLCTYGIPGRVATIAPWAGSPRRCLRGPPRVTSWPLRDHQEADQDEHGDDRRSERSAHVQPAFGDRLVEEIAHRRTERPREDERRPEQPHA